MLELVYNKRRPLPEHVPCRCSWSGDFTYGRDNTQSGLTTTVEQQAKHTAEDHGQTGQGNGHMETTELDRDPPQESAEPNPQVACHQHGTVGGTAVALRDIVYRQEGKNGEGKALSHAEADAAQVEGRLTGYQCDQSDEGSAEHHGDGQQSSVAQGPEQPAGGQVADGHGQGRDDHKEAGIGIALEDGVGEDKNIAAGHPQHNEELNNGRARRGGIQKLPQAVERIDLLGFPDNRRPAFLIPAQKGQYGAQHAEGKGKVKIRS